jgi:hypothetical protein
MGILAAAAIILMLPTALGPVPLNDSHWINLVWSDQFTSLMRAGQIWPRWLPASHDGLGSPAFYFYGPVAFWLTGLFALAGLGQWPALVATATVALAASGILAWIWFRRWAVRPLAGALFFMAAPYHFLDFTRRGALAEFVAITLFPALAIGVRRAADGKPAALALAYAALCMTHVPTAVLASVFLMPMLLLRPHRLDVREIGRVGCALLLGIGLAAAYLLPALSLQSATAMGVMHGTDAMRPSAWHPASFWGGGLPTLMLLGCIGIALAFIGIATLLAERGWSVLLLGIVAASLGFTPFLWSLPVLDRVQFPWRALSLAEFAAATLIACASVSDRRLLIACAPLLIASTLIFAGDRTRTTDAHVATLLRLHPDVIEYVPPGVGERIGIESKWALRLAAQTPPSRTEDGITTLRRFAFPGAQIRCGQSETPSWPEPGTGLIQYRGKNCHVQQTATPSEQRGGAIALLSLLVLAIISLRQSLDRKRQSSTRVSPALNRAAFFT